MTRIEIIYLNEAASGKSVRLSNVQLSDQPSLARRSS